MADRFRPLPPRPPRAAINSNDNNSPPPVAPGAEDDASADVGIAPYVRHVFLQAGTRDDDEQPIPRDTELRASLLTLFPNVEQFDLVNMRWGRLRSEVRHYFVGPHSHMISALSLREVAFPALGELVRLVRGLRALKVLRLRCVVWEESQGQGHGGGGGEVEEGNSTATVSGHGHSRGQPSPSANPSASSDAPLSRSPPTRPQLEDLEIYECTSPGALISHLLTHAMATALWERSSITGERLQRVALDWRGREEDPTILRNLILDAGAALQILEVDLAWQRVYPTFYSTHLLAFSVTVSFLLLFPLPRC